mgnify:CR=1 FL=1
MIHTIYCILKLGLETLCLDFFRIETMGTVRNVITIWPRAKHGIRDCSYWGPLTHHRCTIPCLIPLTHTSRKLFGRVWDKIVWRVWDIYGVWVTPLEWHTAIYEYTDILYMILMCNNLTWGSQIPDLRIWNLHCHCQNTEHSSQKCIPLIYYTILYSICYTIPDYTIL